ncbi:MAG: methionyl-tRNA formyltransferase [Minisyncoccia bacterium]
MNLKYFYFGSSPFSALILEKLIEKETPPLLVITQSPKLSHRKKIGFTLVHQSALKNKIKVLAPEKLDQELLEKLKNFQADFALLCGYGKIIPPALLNLLPYGFLNLHPSLLPKYRGATPIQSVILNGEKETGITLFKMDEELDHGPIISQEKINLNEKITTQELEKILAEKGVNLFLTSISDYLENKIILIPQDHKEATYCFKLKPEDEKIDFKKTLIEIDRKIRALNPSPGVYAEILDKNNQKLRIKILKGYPVFDPDFSKDIKAGTILEKDNRLIVKTKEGYYVLELIKPASKKEMKASDFLKGNQWLKGKAFL